eukprot:1688857-Rhodomonas_salina.1
MNSLLACCQKAYWNSVKPCNRAREEEKGDYVTQCFPFTSSCRFCPFIVEEEEDESHAAAWKRSMIHIAGHYEFGDYKRQCPGASPSMVTDTSQCVHDLAIIIGELWMSN